MPTLSCTFVHVHVWYCIYVNRKSQYSTQSHVAISIDTLYKYAVFADLTICSAVSMIFNIIIVIFSAWCTCAREVITIVCYRSIDFLRGLYNKMNITDYFTLISKGFQLRGFSKSFRSRVTASIVHFGALGRSFLSSRDLKWHTLHTWLRILPGSLGMPCESI